MRCLAPPRRPRGLRGRLPPRRSLRGRHRRGGGGEGVGGPLRHQRRRGLGDPQRAGVGPRVVGPARAEPGGGRRGALAGRRRAGGSPGRLPRRRPRVVLAHERVPRPPPRARNRRVRPTRPRPTSARSTSPSSASSSATAASRTTTGASASTTSPPPSTSSASWSTTRPGSSSTTPASRSAPRELAVRLRVAGARRRGAAVPPQRLASGRGAWRWTTPSTSPATSTS